jgi:hypothetical protein
MLVFQYSGGVQTLDPPFDASYIDEQSRLLGKEIAVFWQAVKEAARKEADRNKL